jgi:hypothetical protein
MGRSRASEGAAESAAAIAESYEPAESGQLLPMGRDHDTVALASEAASGSIPFRAIADGVTGE